jgi:phage repressor protein C with HTH and peptisase S24 domain
MEKSANDRLLELLDIAVEKHGSMAEIHRLTGISNANLTYWKQRNRSPRLNEFSKILDLLGCKILLPEELPDYADIPKVSAKAGAGSSLITDAEVAGYYAFRRQFLTRMGISERKAVLLDVIGDSMSPLLKNGDTILVDQGKRDLYEGFIYLIGLGDELLVKRLHRHAKGWTLISQNPGYPPVTLDETDSESLRVYGRVMWSGHVFPS